MTATQAHFVSDGCSVLAAKSFLQCPCPASMAADSLCITGGLFPLIVPILSQFLRFFSAVAVRSGATDWQRAHEKGLPE